MDAQKDEITPEALAAALYDVLDKNSVSTVAGDSRDGIRTAIDRRWNLLKVSRQVLVALRHRATHRADG